MKESQKTICLVRNIAEQKQYEELMKYVAEHNDLTNLPNRRRLLADLEFAINKEDLKILLCYLLT
jgi:GGDEF domain-containing protein